MNDNDLKPCPFCGSEAAANWYYTSDEYERTVYYVHCTNADCDAFSHEGKSPEEAAAAWNRRPQPTPAQVASLAKEAGAEGVWIIRGDNLEAVLGFAPSPTEELRHMYLERPCQMVLLARFPAGDGKEAGIEHV